MTILLGFIMLVLYFIAKFKRKTMVSLTNRTILDNDKLVNSLSLCYLIAGVALLLIGLADFFQVISNDKLISKTISLVLIAFGAFYSRVYFKYTYPKSS